MNRTLTYTGRVEEEIEQDKEGDQREKRKW